MAAAPRGDREHPGPVEPPAVVLECLDHRLGLGDATHPDQRLDRVGDETRLDDLRAVQLVERRHQGLKF